MAGQNNEFNNLISVILIVKNVSLFTSRLSNGLFSLERMTGFKRYSVATGPGALNMSTH